VYIGKFNFVYKQINSYTKMKNYLKLLSKITTITLLSVILSFEIHAQNEVLAPEPDIPNFFRDVEAFERYLEDAKNEGRTVRFKQFERWKHFWESRVMPDGSYPDANLLLDTWNVAKEKDDKKRNSDMFQSMPQWREIGPTEDPLQGDASRTNMGVGRLNVVKVHPTNPQEIWVGSASGGAWVSKNGGQTWSVLYQTEFLSLGASDITFAPSNPQTVYIATGDVYGSLSSMGLVYSIGILKSTDGGQTWQQTGHINELSQRRTASRVWVHPTNENIVIAATSSGIIKSTDGGQTWELKYNDRFIDMEQMPNNPNVLYASTMTGTGSGNATIIVRTKDGGETWQEIHRIQGGRRTCIEVTPASPNSLYVMTCNSTGGFHSLIISDDQGDTWEQTNIFASKRINYLSWSTTGGSSTNGQGWYDLAMAVSPTNANQIFIGGINIWRSNNKGKDFTCVAHWSADGGVPYVHADIHDMRFHGSDLYVAHDGGLDITKNPNASPITWSPLNKGLGIAQIYRFSNSRQNPNNIVIGLQDLGTRRRDANNRWYFVHGGDGMDCVYDPKDERRMYFSIYFGTFWRRYEGGNSTRIIDSNIITNAFGTKDVGAWVTPIVVSAIDPRKVYVGYSNIYFSNNYGESNSWRKLTSFSSSSSNTFRNMRISEKDDNYIYAATQRALYVTTDGGHNQGSWRNITLPQGANNNINGIAIHPDNPNIAYISFAGYNANSKFYRYDNAKNEWTNLSGNLPNVPANCIELHLANGKLNIYVGTDIGVYHAINDVPYFKRWGDGLPNLYVSQLEVAPSINKLRAASYGRGVWEVDLNICSFQQIAITSEGGKLEFCRQDSLRLFVATSGESDIVWSTGETTNEIWVKDAGRYWAVSNANSECIKTSNFVDVSVIDTRNLTVATPNSVDVCIGDSITMTARNGFASYQWYKNNAEIPHTEMAITVKESGEYYVRGLNEDSDCFSTSEVIKVNMYPRPEKPTVYLVQGTFNENNPTNTFDTLFAATQGIRFIWYKNGTVISGQNTHRLIIQRIEANEGELYTVSVAENGTCYSEQSEPFEYTDIYEVDFTAFNIIPNPAKKKLTIELNEKLSGNYSISIIDLQGIRVLKIDDIFIDDRFDIAINHLASGTYLLNIVSKNNNLTRKFIKE
jgi:photosystem II stability/assembly factor-like uncharacterized protein